MLGLSIPCVAVRGGITLSQQVASLFSASEPGVWYDPSDLSTLFQDAAGTIPVTGVEQPVGLILDKSGRGNHASQPTTTARPILSARYNILTDTAFTSAAQWGIGNWVFSGGEADPFGGTAAAKVQMGGGAAQAPGRIIGPVAGDVVFRVWWKAGNQAPVSLAARDDTTATILGSVRCDTGAVTGTVTGSIIRQQNGFNLVELRTTAFPPGNTLRIYLGGPGGVAAGTHSFWYGPDLRLVCDAGEGPTYQYVAPAAASYEVAGFSRYLRFDGVDDFLDAGTLDFSAATQAAAVIGSKKLRDVRAACPYSHGLSTGQNGAFRFIAPANPGQASVQASTRGADGVLRETVGANDKAAPIKLVLCSTYGADAPVSIRYNGTESRVSSGSLGALTLPSARSVIGAQVTGETTQSNFFTGRIYGLVHIARALSLGEQHILEQFMRNKSRAY